MKKQHEKMILWSIIVISVLSVVPLLHTSHRECVSLHA